MRIFSGASSKTTPPQAPPPSRVTKPESAASAAIQPSAPLPITATEPLCRFIFDTANLKANGRVYWRAFRPKPTETDLSIARIEGFDEAATWRFGDEVVVTAGRTIHGRADFELPLVHKTRSLVPAMDAVPAEPPVRHAAIIGWPPNDEEARKTVCMMIAAEVSAKRRAS